MTLEQQLDLAALRLATATTPARRRQAWADLQRLHKERAADPNRVADLERDRGLRP